MENMTIEFLIQVSLLVLIIISIIGVLKLIFFLNAITNDTKKVLSEAANILENTASLSNDAVNTITKIKSFSFIKLKK